MMKLYMVLIGCKPPGRHTEQHDIFFGIAENLKGLVPSINQFWPEVKNAFHIDAWREVTLVDNFSIQVFSRAASEKAVPPSSHGLFFLNLGGYKPGEFEEYHYKMLSVCADKSQAIQRSKATAFFKHTGYKGAAAHIDDKYGVDVDDIYNIEDILPPEMKKQYGLHIQPSLGTPEDEWNAGYLPLRKI